jgi:hypothetical protein
MSLGRILQKPVVVMALAIVAIVLVGLTSDVLIGVVVVIPLLLAVWWARIRYLTVLREALQTDARKNKLSLVQYKES